MGVSFRKPLQQTIIRVPKGEPSMTKLLKAGFRVAKDKKTWTHWYLYKKLNEEEIKAVLQIFPSPCYTDVVFLRCPWAKSSASYTLIRQRGGYSI